MEEELDTKLPVIVVVMNLEHSLNLKVPGELGLNDHV